MASFDLRMYVKVTDDHSQPGPWLAALACPNVNWFMSYYLETVRHMHTHGEKKINICPLPLSEGV